MSVQRTDRMSRGPRRSATWWHVSGGDRDVSGDLEDRTVFCDEWEVELLRECDIAGVVGGESTRHPGGDPIELRVNGFELRTLQLPGEIQKALFTPPPLSSGDVHK